MHRLTILSIVALAVAVPTASDRPSVESIIKQEINVPLPLTPCAIRVYVGRIARAVQLPAGIEDGTEQCPRVPPPRYVIQIFVSAQNLTNHANYTGYSGTLTSPFFGQPTAVGATRKIDFGVNMNF